MLVETMHSSPYADKDALADALGDKEKQIEHSSSAGGEGCWTKVRRVRTEGGLKETSPPSSLNWPTRSRLRAELTTANHTLNVFRRRKCLIKS